jgi:sulfide dehydrogenase cytochrome subunit
MKNGLFPAIFALALTSAIAADSPPPSVAPCIECHGVAGVAAKPGVPHIDGQHAQYMQDSLRAFAKDSRMSSTAAHKGLSRDALNEVVAHYAGQKVTRPHPATDPALVARGETIYNNRCADCHMDNGRESDKDAPIMAGQDPDYLARQALLYRKGDRRFPTMMDDAYRGLSEADLKAVAHFFAAQDPVAAPSGAKGKRRK